LTNRYETLEAAKDSDVIIYAIGEDAYTETPGNIDSLLLPESQFTLANDLAALNKKLVVTERLFVA
jgi:beta-glucosidase